MSRTLITELDVAGTLALKILSFRESHQLGVPARVTVSALFRDYQALDDVIGASAGLAYGYEGGPAVHRFCGVVDAVTILGTTAMGEGERTVHYEMEIVATLELLSRSFGCSTFQDLAVPDILKKVFEQEGLPADLFVLRLSGRYVPRPWCVRYQESVLAFVTRLCEDEGIFFFSEPTDAGAEKIVFADDSTAAAPVDGDPKLACVHASNLQSDTDAIYSLRERSAVCSGRFVLRDVNFEKPSLDLTSAATGEAHADLEIYEYPGGYVDAGEGKRRAQLRLDAEQVDKRVVRIEADSVRIAIGRTITIIDSQGPADRTYVIVECTMVYESQVQEQGGLARDRFSTAATLLPSTQPFRLRTLTPKPVIAGPQTGIVVAPAGSEAEEIHTDEHGRIKVKFHWDLGPDVDDKASAWFRTEQLQTSGSMILPRVGWEVIVDFAEGDPDRPTIVGRVYNGMLMPPYALPEGKTRTAFKTVSTPGGGGSNEIRLEDKAGAEEIMIHTQKDATITVANDKKTTIGNNETVVVKVDSTLEVHGSETVKVTKGCKTQIASDQTVRVDGARTVEVNALTGLNVAGKSTTTVGGGQMSMVGNPLQALLALAAEKATEVAKAKAGEALAHIDAAIQSKVDQALGPVGSLVSQAKALGDGMQSLGSGDLSAVGSVLNAAGSLPSASGFASALGGGSGGSAAMTPAGGGQSAAEISASGMLSGAVNSAIQKGVTAAASALGSAMGIDGGTGGGVSGVNVTGPAGDVDGVDQTDRTKGPGHTLYKVTGKHTETVSSIKALLALQAINTNVSKDKNESVTVAKVEAVLKDYAESAEGSKDELAGGGMLVFTKGDESESVKGNKTTMVGGPLITKVKGNRSIEAKAPATFVGAFHKVEAKEKITFTCGESSIVVDGTGVTITSPMVMVTAGKIQLTKSVTEV